MSEATTCCPKTPPMNASKAAEVQFARPLQERKRNVLG